MGRRYKRRRRSPLRIIAKILCNSFILVMVVLMCLLFIIEGTVKKYQDDAKSTIESSTEEDFINYNTTYIYDSDGKTLAKLSDSGGTTYYLRYEKIPENVVNAFVAVEDQSFWTNEGYDIKGIVRVLFNYAKSFGKNVAGASTITQQLVRMQYLSTEKTLDRKIKEIFLAIEMTQEYSKEEIMEYYINNCYFANGLYGIEAAAKSYFGVKAKKLSLSQVAYLCAIPNSPTYYDPREDPDRALTRRDKILRNMLECRYITQKQYDEAIAEEIVIKDAKSTSIHDYQTTYALDCAIEYFMEMDGFSFEYVFEEDEDYEEYQEEYQNAYQKAKEKIYQGGYKIYTSLDSSVQSSLQTVVNEEFSDKETGDDGVYDLQAAVTAIDNETGKVMAVIGGRRQSILSGQYTYNRAFQSYRQPGSTIKPLAVYTPALMKDYSAYSTVENIDVTEANKIGTDVDSLHGDMMTLREGVWQSKNGVAYYVMNQIGVNYGIEFLTNMHFSKIVPEDYSLTTAIGGMTYGTNTVEMASGYATLVNEGIYREPTCITSILDMDGNEIYEESEEIEIYDAEAANEMIDILKGVLTVGTAKDIGWDNEIPAAGKTGTTNDNKDGWFCGVTPYYTISVWVGYDTPKTLEDLYGSSYPAEIWKKSMEILIEGKDYKGFTENEEEEQEETTWSENNYDDEKYLPGRSDDEVLSSGYTVADYRSDRTIGEDVDAVISEIDSLPNDSDLWELESLYEDGQDLVDSIYSMKYTNEKQEDLDNAYYDKKALLEEAEETRETEDTEEIEEAEEDMMIEDDIYPQESEGD